MAAMIAMPPVPALFYPGPPSAPHLGHPRYPPPLAPAAPSLLPPGAVPLPTPPDINAVYRGVWIGGRNALRSRVLNECGILHVLNTSSELLNPNTPVDWADLQMNGIYIQHVRWMDNAEQRIFPLSTDICDGLRFVHECVEAGRPVLVNCLMGISRSSSMVIAYLIVYHRMPFPEALRVVKAGRACASPNLSFTEQLTQLATQVAHGLPFTAPGAMLHVPKAPPPFPGPRASPAPPLSAPRPPEPLPAPPAQAAPAGTLLPPGIVPVAGPQMNGGPVYQPAPSSMPTQSPIPKLRKTPSTDGLNHRRVAADAESPPPSPPRRPPQPIPHYSPAQLQLFQQLSLKSQSPPTTPHFHHPHPNVPSPAGVPPSPSQRQSLAHGPSPAAAPHAMAPAPIPPQSPVAAPPPPNTAAPPTVLQAPVQYVYIPDKRGGALDPKRAPRPPPPVKVPGIPPGWFLPEGAAAVAPKPLDSAPAPQVKRPPGPGNTGAPGQWDVIQMWAKSVAAGEAPSRPLSKATQNHSFSGFPTEMGPKIVPVGLNSVPSPSKRPKAKAKAPGS